MPRPAICAALALLLVIFLSNIRSAHALELTWADGSKNIDLAATAVCTLLVRPSGSESLLPGRWRLVYVGTCDVPSDSGLIFLNAAGPHDAAPTCSVSGPVSAAERLTNQTTIEFCGPGEGMPTGMAAFIMRLDRSLQVRIAAIPASDIVEIGDATIGPNCEVTVNGGTTRTYPATVWSATQVLDSTGASQVELTGVGLENVQSVVAQSATAIPERAATSIPARSRAAIPAQAAAVMTSGDTLEIVSQSPTFIVARSQAPLTQSQVVVLGSSTDDATAATTFSTQTPAGGSSLPVMFPGGTIRPKDFAFIYALGQFHLFYIRHDDSLPDSSTELDFGHAVSTNLFDWTQLSPVVAVRANKWDNGHVWAPTIIENNGVFYMFYTGVTKIPTFGTGYQRIGVATSTDLMNWTRYDAPVFGGNYVPWAFSDSSQWQGCQFRDPFVMVDPANAAQWLIYDVATPQVSHTQVIVGAGKNATGLSAWQDVKPFWNTDSTRFLGHCESPHVFDNSGLWYLFLTSNSGHPLQVEYANDPMSDAAGWAGSWSLYRVLGNDSDTDGWFASEHLKVGPHDYFAFVNYFWRGIEIREMSWGPPPSGGAMPTFTLNYPSVAAVEGDDAAGGLELTALGCGLPSHAVTLRLRLPSSLTGRVDVYDVVGRRVQTLARGTLRAGDSLVSWDGRVANGAAAGNGVYFARLATAAGMRSTKVVLMR